MGDFCVVFKPETALRPDHVQADGVDVLVGEGLLVFGPTEVNGRYHRPPSIPLRYVDHVSDDVSGKILYPR